MISGFGRQISTSTLDRVRMHLNGSDHGTIQAVVDDYRRMSCWPGDVNHDAWTRRSQGGAHPHRGGLRSNDWDMPEEIDKWLLIDSVTSCSPLPADAVDNLGAEGSRDQIFLVGNVMVDTAQEPRTSQERRSLGLGVQDGALGSSRCIARPTWMPRTS